MPAKSKAQQRYMAMVATGKIDAPKGLSKKEARKMAKTKHDDLPDRVTEGFPSFKSYLLNEDVVDFKHPATAEIDKIMSWPIKGNAHADGELMQAIHQFVANEKNPMSLRTKAIAKLDKVMGQPEVKVTAQDVEEYLAQH